MQIVNSIRKMTITPVLQYVEGHQDTKYPDRPLLWEARLNQQWDKIATKYLEELLPILYTTSFFPASKVSLQVSNTTITHHIPSQICTLAGYHAQRCYLCKHHNWDQEAFDLINWPQWHQAIHNISFLNRLFIIKWVNDLLPLQAQQYKFHQSPTASCPSSCGCSSEEWTHLLQCPHPHRRNSWQEFHNTLQLTLNQHQWDPTLRRILTRLILTVIEPNAPDIPINNIPPKYSMLLTTQLQLGPDSIFFGFFVHKWTQLQDWYLRAQNLPHHCNQAATAIHTVSSALLLQVQSIWLIRNTHLHGTDPLQQQSYVHLHLLIQIQELYDCLPLMRAADRDILSIPYSSRLEQPTSTLRNFY